MRKKLVGLSLAVIPFSLVAQQQTFTYEFSHIWTDDNKSSGAPTPYCSCDTDPDALDCPSVFDSDDDEGEICYDEYIPSGSRGWVHAKVYKRMN